MDWFAKAKASLMSSAKLLCEARLGQCLTSIGCTCFFEPSQGFCNAPSTGAARPPACSDRFTSEVGFHLINHQQAKGHHKGFRSNNIFFWVSLERQNPTPKTIPSPMMAWPTLGRRYLVPKLYPAFAGAPMTQVLTVPKKTKEE